ncbi:MAG TPA: glycosyltransferase family 4 protein [Bacteroidales bacterium]|nr:glycosyltransferase family 4 protein [Bacteroidales bacterium]HSA43502.1 glycosyltransferase family 4 protein [Bacteroidales bacterium]
MKKVLIITYYWPPSGGAGVQRWLKFVKYLPSFGWEPIVYTVSNPEYPELDPGLGKDIPPGITVLKTRIKEPYRAYKRFIGRNRDEKIAAGFLSEKKKPGLAESVAVWIRGNLFIPDARRFWIRPSVRYLTRYVKSNPPDVIISTGPPHSCHLIALGLKKASGLPWLADFRDPWTGIDFYRDLRLTRYADAKHKRLEKKVLQYADEVIMISPSQAVMFRNIYDRNYHVITNGYDPDDFPAPAASPAEETFSLTHVGSLVPSRNPKGLWTALASLAGEVPGFREHLVIRLAGQVDHSVISSIREAGLSDRLIKTDYLPHEQAVALQQSASVLLLLINDTPNAKSILTGKFFEYLAAGRPVLCIGPPDGDAAAVLQHSHAGHTADYHDIDAMKMIVFNFYRLWLGGTLQTGSGETGIYSRKNLTRQLAALLSRMTVS